MVANFAQESGWSVADLKHRESWEFSRAKETFPMYVISGTFEQKFQCIE